jgi:hypothetical protein
MTLKKKVRAYLESRENQARLFIIAWYISLVMMVIGYLIIAYLLLFQ